jgi:hypothetical protein
VNRKFASGALGIGLAKINWQKPQQIGFENMKTGKSLSLRRILVPVVFSVLIRKF